jgi:hypothetical protein
MSKFLHQASMPFRRLLYRFFDEWLFRDVNQGTVWERSAAWRHNREQARWLLCRYITRPALANERVQTNAAGQVVLKLKTVHTPAIWQC